jgi:hypothetical protein
VKDIQKSKTSDGEVIVQLRVQNPLGQRLFQLIEKPVLGKHFLWIAPRSWNTQTAQSAQTMQGGFQTTLTGNWCLDRQQLPFRSVTAPTVRTNMERSVEKRQSDT